MYAQIDFERARIELRLSRQFIDSLTIGSHQPLPFICHAAPCGCVHKWICTVKDRAGKGSGCPGCSPQGLLACEHNNVAVLHPRLLEHFDPAKNTHVQLDKVREYCNTPVLWTCACKHCGEQHEWSAKISSRTFRGDDCPICAKYQKRTCRCQSLGVLQPDLCSQINVDLSPPHDIYKLTRYSMEPLVWNCSENKKHRPWVSTVANRNRPHGCPSCQIFKLEVLGADTLKNMGLLFQPQYKFNKEDNKSELCRYDFAVADRQGDWFLIEVDGTQHFEGQAFTRPKKPLYEYFADQVKRDLDKDHLAMQHRIDLLRVPYTVTTVEEMQACIEHFLASRANIEPSTRWFMQCVNHGLYSKRTNDYNDILESKNKDKSKTKKRKADIAAET